MGSSPALCWWVWAPTALWRTGTLGIKLEPCSEMVFWAPVNSGLAFYIRMFWHLISHVLPCWDVEARLRVAPLRASTQVPDSVVECQQPPCRQTLLRCHLSCLSEG